MSRKRVLLDPQYLSGLLNLVYNERKIFRAWLYCKRMTRLKAIY